MLHQLRHTFASLSNDANIPEFNISKALGHAQPTTTKKIYTHVFDNKHTVAIDSVATIIDNVSQKAKAAKATDLLPVISDVILKWNPIGFENPEKEYTEEIQSIAEKAAAVKDKSQLGNLIYDIFKEMFGLRQFKKSLEECIEIAGKILK